ncbi:MAG: GNAT family N-acetyltransferase [Oscillatoriales cyanobacterium]|nr:MAG: GNAT family N-acetyltransferase [Oscillatoriales cyanobacterium]
MISSFQVRSARPEDVAAIFQLIGNLAAYEQLSHQVTGSPELLRSHLFGDRPFAEALVAETTGSPLLDASPTGEAHCSPDPTLIGMALFFHNYSTFLTRPGLYLEDLFVLPDYRSQGVGKALLQATIDLARDRQCGRVEWSVLDWNAPAIAFYERMGAEILPDWRTCRVLL